MFGNIGTIWAELGLNSAKFNKGMKLAESRVALAGKKMQTIGRTLTMGVSLPLMAVGVAASKAGMDFDSSMTKSLAIMKNITPQIRSQMEQTAKDVVKYTTFSAKEGADAYFYLASAGLDAAQSMEALPRVARFAQAGNFDLALATDLLTDAQSALGLTIRDDVIANMENMTRVSDVLVKANTLSNATVKQFSESLTNKAGAAMKLLNIDIEEGVAVLAAWADQGVKGAEAGNYFNIVTRDLQRAAILNTEVFKDYGISVYDTSGNMRNMADVVKDLEVALDGMSDKEKRATLMMLGFQDRSISAMMTLLGTSDAIRGYESDLRSATEFTEDVASKQMESFTAQMEQLKNELINVGISIFDILRPNFEDLLEQVKKGIDWFEDLTEGQKKLAVNIGLVVAAIGPALWIFGQLATIIPKVTTAYIGLNTAIKGSALVSLAPVMASLATGLGLLAMEIEYTKKIFVGFDEVLVKLQENKLDYWFGFGEESARMMAGELGHLYEETNKLGELYPSVIEEASKLSQQFIDGKISSVELADGLLKINQEARDYVETANPMLGAMQGMETASKNLASETEDTTEALEDQEEAIDDLKQSFSELINEIFGITNAENALQEAEWDLVDARKAVIEATKEYGIGSREAEQAINNYDGALQNNLATLGELYNEEGISIARKEELRNKYIELAADAVLSGEISEVAAKAMAAQFGISSIDIYNAMIKIKSGSDTAIGGVSRLQQEINKLSGKEITITTLYKRARVSAAGTLDYFAKGGIPNFAKGGLPNAAPGWVTPSHDNGGILATVHKNEVILNSQQQAKLLFDIAKSGKSTGGKTGDIHLHLEYNEELASQTFAKLFSQEIGKLT